MSFQTVACVFAILGVALGQTPPPFPGGFQFQTVSIGSLPNFTISGLNDQGDTVGHYADSTNRQHGVLRSAAGVITVVDIPGAFSTSLTAINNAGEITGNYFPTDSSGSRAFLRRPDGTIVLRDVPGAFSVALHGISSGGRMVGTYDGHGLIFEPNGSFNFFDVSPVLPAGQIASATARAINDSGQIVGIWTPLSRPFHGCFFREATGVLSYPSPCSGLVGINNAGLQSAYETTNTRPYVRDLADRRAYVVVPFANATVTTHSLVSAINHLNVIAGNDSDSKPFIATPCAASITPTSQAISAAGGIVTVQVTAASGCTSSAGIPISSAFGTILTPFVTGNGAFTIEVPAHTASSAARSETIYIAGNAFTLTQAGAQCDPNFTTAGTAVGAAGAIGSATVTAPAGCAWTAVSDSSWLQLTNGSGSGDGSIQFTAATNPGPAARTAVINLAQHAFFVNQSANSCSYLVTPGATSFSAAGGSGSIDVKAAAGCQWTVLSNQTWLTVSGAASRTGNGTVEFTAVSNPGSARSASLNVAGTAITIQQSATSVSGLAFVPVTPCRLMDTRPGEGRTGAFGPPFLSGGTTRDVPVPSGGCGIPSNARAYSVNATVVPRRALAYLTLHPTGQPRPNASTLNAFEGQIIANAAIVPAGLNGSFSVFATDDTELILDLNGYFTDPATPGSLVFYPMTPCRVIDTRVGTGGPGGTFGPPTLVAGQNRTFPVRSSGCAVPATTGAYVLNITVVPRGPLDYITAWPGGQPRPLVSVQNSPQGRVLANAAIVPAGTNGDISLFAPQATDVVVDISGYFAPAGQAGGLRFYPVDPCRIADTRPGSGFVGGQGPPILGTQTSRLFPAAGLCNVNVAARALSLNLTVVPPGYLGFVTLYPGPQRPLVSTLNAWEAQVAANAAIVPGDPTGGVNVYVSNSTQVILDVTGFFAP